jgi:4-hydroxybenzoate polyprenyltransferase
MRAILQLLRPANVVTALADVLAGAAAAGLVFPGRIGWLLGSTCCLYAGGVVLNYVFDRRIDAVERPERPIPSGRIGAGPAGVLGTALLGAGVLLAVPASTQAAGVAAAIVCAVVLYDGWSKHHAVLGPVNMGACRGLTLVLGLAAVPGGLAARWPLMFIAWTYIAAVTVVSRGEVLGGSRRVGTLSLGLLAAVLAALVGVSIAGPAHPAPPLVLTLWLAWRVLPPFRAARERPDPAVIRTAVRAGVLSLVLLDAVIASAYAGMIYGLAVLATALLAFGLARQFAVT